MQDMRILLHSGEYFYFEKAHECTFNIRDIAHSLSLLCRFGGHCPQFYSVAQHSVNVSLIVEREAKAKGSKKAPEIGLAGLLHDATEAFLGDVTKPLKELLPFYKELEDDLAKLIFQRHSLPWPMPAVIKKADIQMLATEQRYLLRNNDKWFGVTEEPLNMPLMPFDPRRAKTLFLERFHALMAERSEGGQAEKAIA